MNKLELKYLAPYLPYELKGKFRLSEASILARGQKDEIRDKILNIDNVHFFLKYCKPVLRPLSDLMPYDNDEIDGMGETNDMILIRLVENTYHHCDAYDEWRDAYFDNPTPEKILQSPYEVFINLLEEHYDVFGLIDAGLAIDINAIKP